MSQRDNRGSVRLYDAAHGTRLTKRNFPTHTPGLGRRFSDASEVASAYDAVGPKYASYADGNSEDLFDFNGSHAYADRTLWARVDIALRDLRELGTTKLRVLDAGCGPGTWLRRLVTRAMELGFTEIDARGFDIAHEQIGRARSLASDLAKSSGIRIRFDVADLTKPLPEPDESVDITLCLYSVLSHLPVIRMKQVAAEITRVTRGTFITTVRPRGSQSTAFVDFIHKVKSYQHDPKNDRFEITLNDGRNFMLDVHLFSSAELMSLFSPHFAITEISGLDLFHGRFAPDPYWNSLSSSEDEPLNEHLDRLEEVFANNPAFTDYATHLLLVGKKRFRQ